MVDNRHNFRCFITNILSYIVNIKFIELLKEIRGTWADDHEYVGMTVFSKCMANIIYVCCWILIIISIIITKVTPFREFTMIGFDKL